MWKRTASKRVIRTLAALLAAVASSAATAPRAEDAGETACATTGPPCSESRHYSRKQLRTLILNARTIEDHEQLAAYFYQQERESRAREGHQQEILTDYLKNAGKYPSKYPTRGDTARDLASYYRLQAQKAGGQAQEHERLAAELRAAMK